MPPRFAAASGYHTSTVITSPQSPPAVSVIERDGDALNIAAIILLEVIGFNVDESDQVPSVCL